MADKNRKDRDFPHVVEVADNGTTVAGFDSVEQAVSNAKHRNEQAEALGLATRYRLREQAVAAQAA